jgi:hypothetical protein
MVRARGAEAADLAYIQRSNTTASVAKSVSSRTTSDSSLRQFRANTKEEYTLPSYHSPSPEPQQHTQTPISPSLYSRATWCSKKKFFSRKKESMGPPLPVVISAPYNFESQFPIWQQADSPCFVSSHIFHYFSQCYYFLSSNRFIQRSLVLI